MDHPRFRFLMTAFVFTLTAYAVQAQTDPQLKPGLWQIHIEREVNGQKAPDMADRMKNMSPETRAKMEAALKQRGIEAGDNGGTKACYSKDMLSQSRWAEQQTGCKYDFSTRSSTLWKWHYTCPQLVLKIMLSSRPRSRTPGARLAPRTRRSQPTGSERIAAI